MSINIDAKDLLKIIKDGTVQKIFIGLLIAVCAFFGGRATMIDKDCSEKEICKDITRDRDSLSRQIIEERAACQEEKSEALEKLAERLEKECNLRISEAIDHCEFSDEIHCPICISVGACRP